MSTRYPRADIEAMHPARLINTLAKRKREHGDDPEWADEIAMMQEVADKNAADWAREHPEEGGDA